MKNVDPPDCPDSSDKNLSESVQWWLLAALSIVVTLGYFIWTNVSQSPHALQAEVHPVQVGARLLRQLRLANSVPNWNIPYHAIGVWFAWLFVVMALGHIASRSIFKPGGYGLSAKVAISFAVGFTLIAFLQTMAGLFGLLQAPLIWLLLPVAGCIALLKSSRGQLAASYRTAIRRGKQSSVGEKIAVGTAMLLILVLALPALTPPVQSDGVRYHLGAVQEYLKAGRIVYLPLNAYSNMPFLVEMHFLSALACHTPEAAQLIHYTLALFAGLAIYSVVRMLNCNNGLRSVNMALLAPLMYLSIPASAVIAAWPFTDHAISFFLVVSMLLMLRLRSEPAVGISAWIVFGLCLGGLLGTKYTMFPSALLLFAGAILTPQWNLKRAAACAGAATLVGGVWLAKNAAYTGNPFYPLLSQLFSGGEWTAETNRFLHDRAGEKGISKNLIGLFSSPWQATFHWLNFEQHNAGIAPILVIIGAVFSVAKFLNGKQRGAILLIFTLGALNYLVWFFSYQSNRLLLPVVAVTVTLLPAAVRTQVPTLARRLYTCAVIFASAHGFCWAIQWAYVTTGLSPAPLTYLTGQISPDRYRHESLTYARAFDYLNAHVPPDDTVLLVGEHRIFGARFNALWSDWFDQPALAYLIRTYNIHDIDALSQQLQQLGIRWVMINDLELSKQSSLFKSRFSPSEWKLFQDMSANGLKGFTVKSISPGSRIFHSDAGSQ